MKRMLLTDSHLAYRDACAQFIATEIAPHYQQWEEQRRIPRELYRRLGEQGYLCPWLPRELGGSGADFLTSAIILEELARAQCAGLLLGVHNDIVSHYLYDYGNDEQKRRWLPGCASGEIILAVAMTEPECGSDLASIQTTAVRDGDHYVVNGRKIFISNGAIADLVLVAARGPEPKSGLSLLSIERGTPGFEVARVLDKMGTHIQDTAELAFHDCRVPAANLVGQEGKGMYYLMEKLQAERLVIAISAAAWAESLLEITIGYAKSRKQFGQPLSKFQVHRHKLAELATEIEGARAFVDQLMAAHMGRQEVVKETCMAKYWTTDLLKRMADYGVQLHGGYGYLREYAICRAFVDSRVWTIFGGTNEIMKEIIGRKMGL